MFRIPGLGDGRDVRVVSHGAWRISRFSISLPSNATIDPMRGSIAVSLDGTRVAYVVTEVLKDENRTNADIWIVNVDGSGEPRKLTNSPRRDAHPRWSPDGKWLLAAQSPCPALAKWPAAHGPSVRFATPPLAH
mgnify:CR=1 FL=1